MKFNSLPLLILVMLLLSGCAIGQQIPLYQNTTSKQVVSPYTIKLVVNDSREYVLSGKKESCFIGIYRAGYGNPWDVRTEGKIPLAEIIERDLSTDLQKAGLKVVSSNAQRILEIIIKDYNFDCYVNCRVWHNIQVIVKNEQGVVLAISENIIENTVQGNAFSGPASAMKTQMPQLYGQMISNLALENSKILQALTE